MSAIGQNLHRLRLIRGLTQQQLASAAGLSRNAVVSIEKGAALPRTGHLASLASALDVGSKDLLRSYPVPSTLRFRSLVQISQKEQARRDEVVREFSRWLHDYNQIESRLDQKPPFKLARLVAAAAGLTPEAMAARCREQLGLDPVSPIDDICELCEASGIKIFAVNSPFRAFFGLSVNAQDGGPALAVNVNPDISVERRIFTVAHELGHLLLHTGSYRVEETMEDQTQENAANEFAAYFLMPRQPFVHVWNENRGRDLLDCVLHVKRHFKVSYLTVLHRLVEMKVARADIYKEFAVLCRRRGMSLRDHFEPAALTENQANFEPVPLHEVDFAEDRLGCLVRTAYEKALISFSRAAEIMGVNSQDMRERVQAWEQVPVV